MNIITIPVYTRFLTTEQYGTISIYNSWLSLLMIFATLNMYYGTYNAGMNKYDKNRDEYTSSLQALIIMLLLICFAVYLFFHTIINQVLELPFAFMVSMFIEMFASSILYLWSARERFNFKYKLLTGITFLYAVICPLLTMIVMVFAKDKAYARIVTQAASTGILCIFLAVKTFNKGKKFYSKEYWKFSFLFAVPLIPHYLSTMILNQSDRIMIAYFCGKSEAGIYSVAYSAGMAMTIFATSISQAYGPWLFQKLKNNRYEGIAKATNQIMMAGMIGIILLILLAPECITILASKEYFDAIWIIPPIAASVFFQLLYQLISNVEFYFLKNKFILIASLIAASSNILLNIVFIPRFGYIAAGYTTLASFMLYAYLHFQFVRRTCLNEIKTVIYDGKSIGMIAIGTVAVALILNITYKYVLIRFLLLFVVCLTGIIMGMRYNKLRD